MTKTIRNANRTEAAALHAAVTAAASDAIGPGGRITCRISHVYPDGPAPYFTVVCA